MFSAAVYFCIILLLGSMSWALHWGPQSQLLVLLMGLAVFPLQKFVHKAPIKNLGFRKCTIGQLAKGFILPIAILGLVACVDLFSGAAHFLQLTELRNPFTGSTVNTLWDLFWFLLLNATILFFLEFVTEELMFRGYILGKFVALGELKGVVLSSLFFGVWHLPIAIWGTGLDPVRTPLYLVNMAFLGAVLGLVFVESRSLIPVAAFHAIWNSLEYNLFGFMNQRALLFGDTRIIFDAEEGCVGTLGLALAVGILLALRRGSRQKVGRQAATGPSTLS